jgi:hypothetical protein
MKKIISYEDAFAAFQHGCKGTLRRIGEQRRCSTIFVESVTVIEREETRDENCSSR